MRFVLHAAGILIAYLAYSIGIRKKVTLDNLEKAYPEVQGSDRRDIARRSYYNLGIVFAEMVYLRFATKKNIARHISIDNLDLFQDELKKGKGIIVVAGHFANWEWLALGGAICLGQHFAIVRKNIPKSFVERFLARMRVRTGNTLIDAGDIRGMYRTLQKHGCVALLADQAAPGESVRVPFFGREVPTFEGPARLALRTRTPLLFAECRREENGDYLMHFYPVSYDDLVIDTSENIKELTARHTQILEHIIRRHPDQWLWQHKRWKYA
jgi:KDO2-lipid IV(A) lauroyltransferase